MPHRTRSLECPQCGGRIAGQDQHCCRTCGYVLDMARISYRGALRHDRYEAWRRRLEFVHAAVWTLASIGVVCAVALHPGWIMFSAGILGVIIQVCWGRLILARLRKR